MMVVPAAVADASTPAGPPGTITLGCSASAVVKSVGSSSMALIVLKEVGDRGVWIRATTTANGRSQSFYARGNTLGTARFQVKIPAMRPGQVMTVKVSANSPKGFGWACAASAKR